MLEHVDDKRLIELVMAGDAEAFTALHTRYARRLVGYIHRKLSLSDQRRSLAEDLAQDAFMLVWRDAPIYYDPHLPAAWWIYAQARRAISIYRQACRAQKRQGLTLSLSDPTDGESRMKKETLITDLRPRPDERLLAKEQHQMVVDTLEKLPRKYATPCRMNLNGMDYNTIAETLGTTLSIVTGNISAARKLLRQRLQA